MGKKWKVLVTGGSGFLGVSVVDYFLQESDLIEEIRTFDIVPFPVPSSPSPVKLTPLLGDVVVYDEVESACEGIDVVLHLAAHIDWNPWADEKKSYDVNVKGTKNVLAACERCGVRALVFTSSIEVVFNRSSFENATEDEPIPGFGEYFDAYSRSKAESETLVKNSSGKYGDLKSCVLRPASIWGERDPFHLGNVLKMAKEKKLMFRFGDPKSVMQFVYVGNVAHSCLIAARSLLEDENSRAEGEVFNITDEPAMNFFDFAAPFVSNAGYSMAPRSRTLPFWFMYSIAYVIETSAMLLRRIPLLNSLIDFRPLFITHAVSSVCSTQTMSGEKAKSVLGYRPKFSPEEARERTMEWFNSHPV